MSTAILNSEIEKLVLSRKTYAGLFGMSVLPFLLLIITKSGINAEAALPNSPPLDGWQMVITSMNYAMHIFAPLLIALMAADTLAGESENGTLVLSLTKPIRRRTYLAGKIIAQSLLAAAFLSAFAFMTFVAGSILGYEQFYGVDASGYPSLLVTVDSSQLWWRMVLFFLFAAIGGFVVSLLAIAVSTVSNSGTTVTAFTFIFYMITEILGGALDADFIKYLLSPAIKGLIWSQLAENIVWDDVVRYLMIISAYGLSFAVFAFWRFSRKDID